MKHENDPYCYFATSIYIAWNLSNTLLVPYEKKKKTIKM